MQEVPVFKSQDQLLKAIDNGGRFYNLFSHAGDNTITSAELAYAAGVFTDRQAMFLFLDMALASLKMADRSAVLTRLEKDLRAEYNQNKAVHVGQGDLMKQATLCDMALLEGIPHPLQNADSFQGLIMVPMFVGESNSVMTMPLFDHYSLYRLFPDKTMNKPTAILAAPPCFQFSSERRFRFGGAVREFLFETEVQDIPAYYLEPLYYTVID